MGFCNTDALPAQLLPGRYTILDAAQPALPAAAAPACALMVQDNMPSDSNRQSASDTVIRTAVRASSSASDGSRICVNGVLLSVRALHHPLLHGKTVQHNFTFHDDSAMHCAALGNLHRAVALCRRDSSAASASVCRSVLSPDNCVPAPAALCSGKPGILCRPVRPIPSRRIQLCSSLRLKAKLNADAHLAAVHSFGIYCSNAAHGAADRFCR